MKFSKSITLTARFFVMILWSIIVIAAYSWCSEIYTYRFMPIVPGIKLPVVIALLAIILLQSNTVNFGNTVIKYYIIMLLYPSLIISAIISDNQFNSLTIMILLCIFIMIFLTRLKIPNYYFPVKYLYQVVLIFLCIFISITFYYTPPNFNVLYNLITDLKAVYVARLEHRQSLSNVHFVGYIYGFLKILLPLCVYFALERKDRKVVACILGIWFILFFVGGHKSLLMSLFLTALFLIKRIKNMVKNVYLCLFIGSVITLIIIGTDSIVKILYFDILLRRVVIIPGYFTQTYFDIFQDIDFVNLLENKVNGKPIPFFVGEIIHGDFGARANTGSLAAYIPWFGLSGVLVGTVMMSLLLLQFKQPKFANDENLYIFLVPLLWILIDTKITTALLSQGCILFTILFIRPDRGSEHANTGE